MQIDAIEVYYVKHPLISPWRTAYGEDAETYSVLVRMHSGSYSGWAESCPLYAPTYSTEFAGGVYLLVKEIFAPMLVGREISSARELLELLSAFKGNPFAKAAVEVAWWTLQSEIQQKPLHQLFGGEKKEVEVGADFGITDEIDELIKDIQNAIDAGFKRIKLKARPGWDIDMLREVRKHFPDFTFHIDCNAGYSLSDVPLFKEIDKFRLAMIEQPLFHTDLHEHAKLQAEIETPVCLDESCNSVRAAREAIGIGACRYMNIKPGRVGGLQNSLDIHDMCKKANIPCWVGGMLESSIGAGICVELATLDNFLYPNDIFPSDRFYREEISERRLELSGPGRMKVSDVPGIPFQPLKERLKARTISSALIEKQ